MDNDRAKILNMLKEGKIDVSEAEELLDALNKPRAESGESIESGQQSCGKKSPKYLYITVKPTEGGKGKQEKVNIRIPLQLLRAGVKLASVIPDGAKGRVHSALMEKGLDVSLDDLKGGKLDELIESLTELSIDIDDEEEKVTICCE